MRGLSRIFKLLIREWGNGQVFISVLCSAPYDPQRRLIQEDIAFKDMSSAEADMFCINHYV